MGRGAQDKGLAADRTRAHELGRRLSPCFTLAHLRSLLAVILLIFLVCYLGTLCGGLVSGLELPTADTKGLATSHEAPQTYSRVMPVATSGMIIQLFGGLNPAELTRGRWSFRVVVRRA